MNAVEKRIEETGHLRWSFEKARFIWFVPEPGVVDFKYRFVRDLETMTRTTKAQHQAVALLVDSPELKQLQAVLKQFPRWKTMAVGNRGLATEKPMTVCAKTADVVIAYGSPEWTSALQESIAGFEDGPEVVVRNFKIQEQEHQPLVQEPDPNSRFNGDIERLRHWWRTPAIGLQVRDMIDLRPTFRV